MHKIDFPRNVSKHNFNLINIICKLYSKKKLIESKIPILKNTYTYLPKIQKLPSTTPYTYTLYFVVFDQPMFEK